VTAEIKAGVVVLIGIVILVGGLFNVSGGSEQFRPKSRYTILFHNGGGVSPGTTVYLAGERVGYVHAVGRRTKETAEGLVRYVAVTIEIDKQAPIPVDSVFTVSQTITGIVSLRIDYGTSKQLAGASTELHGERLATFDEAIHRGKLLMDDAQHAIQDLDEAILKFDRKLAAMDVAGIQAMVDRLLDSLGRAATRVESLLEEAQPKIGEALDHLNSGSRDLHAVLARARADWNEMAPKVKGAVADLKQSTETLRAMLEENREPVRSFIQSLDDGAKRVGPVLVMLEELSREARGTVAELREPLVKGVREASAAMTNFKAVTEDLKTAPWKLVNKPSDEESREVHLYNAARLYVAAASRLQDVVGDLDTLRRLGALEDPERNKVVEEVMEELRGSLAKFDDREKRLVELLIASSGK